MSDFYDTRDGEYGDRRETEPTRVIRRKTPIYAHPLLWVGLAVGAVLLVGAFAVSAKAKKGRMYGTGTMAAKYVGEGVKEAVPVLSRPLNRVIFRLDGVEIFRFTYEGGRDGEKLSFEVVEGS